MRVDCGQLELGVVIEPIRDDWHPQMPDRADWRAGRNAAYQLAAHTIDARLAVASGKQVEAK